MIHFFTESGGRPAHINELPEVLDSSTRWIDLLAPDKEEELAVERLTGLEIPTREEIQEIELSSRLYSEANTFFMTTTVVANADSDTPRSSTVTFILRGDLLITVRYLDLHAVQMAMLSYNQKPQNYNNASRIFVLLLEAFTDRLADLLERGAEQLDSLSALTFRAAETGQAASRVDFRQLLIKIGKTGDLVARIRESLTGLSRVYAYIGESGRLPDIAQNREDLAALKSDLSSLAEHANFLSSKTSFLLDATLGMVSIEQNNIIKAMSVAATVFLPPTLIASAYGMNFDFMPELHWHWAYPFVIVIMILSGALPYWFFKRKGWI